MPPHCHSQAKCADATVRSHHPLIQERGNPPTGFALVGPVLRGRNEWNRDWGAFTGGRF
jgi:hypothetical protein